MYNHQPDDYDCPFCRLEEPGVVVVHRAERASAIVSKHWWPRNHGHVLIIPNAHHENIYDLPAEDGHAIFDLTQRLATVMRAAYECDGVSTRQHNEPAGNQDVWHLHQHLFPRYHGDQLYRTPANELRVASVDEQRRYAQLLQSHLHRQD